jgi:hypothetical protein
MQLHPRPEDPREDAALSRGEVVMRMPSDPDSFYPWGFDRVSVLLRSSDGIRHQSLEDLLEAEAPEVFAEPAMRMIPAPLRRLTRPGKTA